MAHPDNPPNATVHAGNLNEKIKLPILEESLREIFSEVGEVVEIIAKRNLRARGQAFIVFDSVESASNAIEDLQGFEVHDKPMRLAFAKSRSDATVKREDGEQALDVHIRQRLAEKEQKKAHEAAQKSLKRSADEDGEGTALADRPAKAKPTGAAAAQSSAAAAALADEYLPPNKTLVLRELPADYTQDQLTVIFGRYAGFREVRMVPGRAGIAFAEYEDETGAIAGKEAMNGVELAGQTIRVTYQRQ